MNETVLITGISGFIAKHIAARLLKRGYAVRGTVRDLRGGEAVRATLAGMGADPSGVAFFEADLEKDDGWTEAVRGADHVMHVASPFPLRQPKGRMDLVPAARGGVLRILNAVKQAAPGAKRIVVTSSIAAVMNRPGRPRDLPLREEDWTDPDWSAASPYVISKTLAERAAWEWAREHGFEERTTAVQPGFVLGPAPDRKSATSFEVIKLFFAGAYPALPPVYFPVVDARDAAETHVAALTAEGTGGRRLLAAADTLSMAEMAAILKAEFPEKGRKIPTRTLPPFLVRFLSFFDRSLKTIVSDMNVVPRVENEYVTALTGVRFRPAREAVLAAGRSLIELGEV